MVGQMEEKVKGGAAWSVDQAVRAGGSVARASKAAGQGIRGTMSKMKRRKQEVVEATQGEKAWVLFSFRELSLLQMRCRVYTVSNSLILILDLEDAESPWSHLKDRPLLWRVHEVEGLTDDRGGCRQAGEN